MTDPTLLLNVPSILPFVFLYLALPGNSVGGALHIVIHDQNVSDDDVEFCRLHAANNDDALGIRTRERAAAHVEDAAAEAVSRMLAGRVRHRPGHRAFTMTEELAAKVESQQFERTRWDGFTIRFD